MVIFSHNVNVKRSFQHSYLKSLLVTQKKTACFKLVYGATNDKPISPYDTYMKTKYRPKAKPLFTYMKWTYVDYADRKRSQIDAYFI